MLYQYSTFPEKIKLKQISKNYYLAIKTSEAIENHRWEYTFWCDYSSRGSSESEAIFILSFIHCVRMEVVQQVCFILLFVGLV